MTNRINGDFDSESMDAFRAAYAAQLANPEDHEIDPFNGLPTNVVSNTSPWLEHTGLWTANNGMSRDFKPNQPFNPKDYLPEDYMPASEENIEEDFAPEVVYDDEVEETEDPMSDEEYEALTERIWGPDDTEEEVIYGTDEDYDTEGNEEDLDDEEIEALIDEILGSDESEDPEDSDGSEDAEDSYEDDNEEE